MGRRTPTPIVTGTERAWRQGLLDEYIDVLVRIQPVPLRLIDSLRRATENDPFDHVPLGTRRRPESLAQHRLLKKYGVKRLSPDAMSDRQRKILRHLCHGRSNNWIAEQIAYSIDTVRAESKVLLIMFDARNRGHLCALAVAGGHVTMADDSIQRKEPL